MIAEQFIPLLAQICELPGWSPAADAGSSTEHALEILHREGWIIPRLDGWEATAKAMDEYPFKPKDEPVRLDEATVSRARVTALIAGMLGQLPIRLVVGAIAADPPSPDSVEWQAAEKLVDLLVDLL